MKKRKSPHRKIIATAVLVFFAVVWVFAVGPPQTVERVAAALGTPTQQVAQTFGDRLKAFFGGFQSRVVLEEENQLLRDELLAIRLDLFDRNVLLEENRALKAALGRGTTSQAAVLAGVLAVPQKSPYGTLIIDAGASDGVEVGDLVRASEAVVLGEAEEVFRSTSRVRLYTSPGTVTEAFVRGSDVRVSVEGEGGSNFSFRIPRAITITRGDEVFLPGIRPLVLGVVGDVTSAEGDAFQTVRFRAPVNMETLRWVFVDAQWPE